MVPSNGFSARDRVAGFHGLGSVFRVGFAGFGSTIFSQSVSIRFEAGLRPVSIRSRSRF